MEVTPKVSLCMIVKNDDREAEILDRCLESIKDMPLHEKIIVATPKHESDSISLKLVEIVQKHNAQLNHFVWTNDFSEARNYSFSLATGDYLFWLDADDVVVDSKLFWEEAVKGIGQNASFIWYNYDYNRDEVTGKSVSAFYRERIVRAKFENGERVFKWIGALHEYLSTEFKVVEYFVENPWGTYVKHLPLAGVDRLSRNLEIITDKYNEEKKKFGMATPGTMYDFARSILAAGNIKVAIDSFEAVFFSKGINTHRFFSAIIAARACRGINDLDNAFKWDTRALVMYPLLPDAYIGLGETFYKQERYNDAIKMMEIALTLDAPIGFSPIDPLRYAGFPLMVLQDCYAKTMQLDKAIEYQNKAVEYYPEDEELKSCISNVKKLKDMLDREKRYREEYHKLTKDFDKKNFLAIAPEDVRGFPFFIREWNRLNPKNVNKRIVIYCSDTIETWDWRSESEGVGGSEEAVINVSKGLAKLGWTVDVFCNTMDVTVNEGVNWYPIFHYDENVPCDIFIAWRNSLNCMLAYKGSKRVLWLHDVPNPADYSPDVVKNIDKVIVLSQAHKAMLPPTVPADKVFISRNGIKPEHFVGFTDIVRDPYKCIYTSSPDRGLIRLLEMWPKIRAEEPRATLHIFYGFTELFNKLCPIDPERKRVKDTIVDLVEKNKDSVFWRGRVGHEEIAKEMLTSGLFLYPCDFYEISCISAMKAQASGAIPVVPSYAALDETVQYGFKVGKDINECEKEWLNGAIGLLKDTQSCESIRQVMMPWAVEKFAYDSLCKDWNVFFESLLQENSK